MKRTLSLLLTAISCSAAAQITILGRNVINNTPVTETKIYVRSGAVTVQTLQTGSKTEFKVQLDFGRHYEIYFHNPRTPLMFMEVKAGDVPENKHHYNMIYKLDVPLVDKNDPDIDTTVFRKAFHRAMFDGRNRMVDDTAYTGHFGRNMFKKEEPEPVVKEEKPAELPVIVAGKVFLEGDRKTPVCNKPISALGASGNVLASTATNRYGAFSFSGLKASEIRKIRMDIPQKEALRPILLGTSKNQQVKSAGAANGYCEWELAPPEVSRLVDNTYSINVGGKLVASSGKGKKFFAGKDVFLSNRLNTIIKRTRTSALGTFVFEDLKPDNQYFIGVNHSEVAPGERIDLLSKEDKFIKTLDTVAGERSSIQFTSDYNQVFNELSIADDEMKMDVRGAIFGDNINSPIGKLKILILNDSYEVIDSSVTDNLGTFRFKYLPFLKRFFLSAENTDNMLDVFRNILIYSSDDNLIKIMTHQKGKKFTYNPVSAEISKLREVELEDPWLGLLEAKPKVAATAAAAEKSIIENILFEYNKYEITPESKEILDKVVVVLNCNKALKIEIGAHTDSQGSETSNLKLSEMRAKTVQKYIVSSGIETGRIMCRGYGESKPLNDCVGEKPCSELEHAVNRRIEFRILGEH
jgi:outer membrane protein OmpA-like peptidoglycan-associated protein